VLNPDFLDDDISLEDFKDSLDIFDDVDVFGTKINVGICFTTHSPCAGNETKILLSEANIITIFAKTTVNRALKYLLDNYIGLDKKQIDKIKKIYSRAVSIIRGYPMTIVAENNVFLAHEF
jgi:hypothetical protein